MNIAELFVKLGVNADTAGLQKFSAALNGIPSLVFNLKNALAGVALAGMNSFVESTVDGVVALQNLNAQTGLSIEMLRKWQIAGQLSNLALSAEEVSNSIAGLQQNLAEISMGRGNIQPFAILGMDVIGKDAFQVLEELRGKVGKLEPAIASSLLGQMGLNPGFISLLKQTRAEFKGLAGTTFPTKEQLDRIQQTGLEFKKLKINMGLLKDMLVADLYPVWHGLIKLTTNLWQGFTFVAESVAKSRVALMSLVGVFAAIAIAMYPIQAAIAGLLLVIDDLVTYFTGKGKSITGLLMEKMGFTEATGDKSFIGTAKNMWDSITGLFTGKMPAPATGTLMYSNKGVQTMQSNGQWSAPVANVNVTNNIHSNAPAKEIADHVNGGVKQQVTKAMQYRNNGGH